MTENMTDFEEDFNKTKDGQYEFQIYFEPKWQDWTVFEEEEEEEERRGVRNKALKPVFYFPAIYFFTCTCTFYIF